MYSSASRPPAKGPVAARSTAKGGKATAASSRAAAPVPAVKQSARSSRAEAVVRHVTHLPSFRAWLATSTAAAPATPNSLQNVSLYLEERVAEVAAQLSALERAGDYARLVVLLAELLRAELCVVGVTSRMVLGGITDLLRAAASAVARGEVRTYAVHGEGQAAAPAWSLTAGFGSGAETPTALSVQPQRPYSGAASVGGGGAAAAALTMPIESLLPPLVEQTVRVPATAAAGWKGAVDDMDAEAEAEAWESYIATARVATSAEAVLPHSGAQTALAETSAATRTAGCGGGAAAAAAGFTGEGAADGFFAGSAAAALVIDSLPRALCVLMTSCTSAPFLCLTLRDQQYEKAAVAALAASLLETIHTLQGSTAEGAKVRHVAWKSLHALLSTAKPQEGEKEGAVRDGAAAAATAAVFSVEAVQSTAMLSELTGQWVRVLALLQQVEANEAEARRHSRGGERQVVNTDSDEEEDDAAAAAALGGERQSPQKRLSEAQEEVARELSSIVDISHTLLYARQPRTHGRDESRPPPSSTSPVQQTLPPHFMGVVLRTLALVPTSPSLAPRAATLARLCIDVLWKAARFAPVCASRQLLYGSSPSPAAAGSDESAAGASGSEDHGCPAVDFFIALLFQFNKTHSVVNREMRDDLVQLLAVLLRHDVQFAEDCLLRRSGVMGDVAERDDDGPLVDAEVAACTPLSLSVSTVEAINAVVALLFETACGAELTACTVASSRTGAAVLADMDDLRPSALLSQETVRSYALRFQSVATSAARRRELVDFKKSGWQLLEVHVGWQLAHLTYREFVNHHDAGAVAGTFSSSTSTAAAGRHHHQRSAPIPQVTGEDHQDEAVTAALWGMQLSRLGYFDVLLSYVDVDSTVPAVVAWTREELIMLEEEAWQLLTSMILFTQHIDAAAGGIRVRRHRRYGPSHSSAQRGGGGDNDGCSSSHGAEVSPTGSLHRGWSAGAGDDGEPFSDADDPAGVLYGADMHFIAAGGVEVALRFLSAAPPEMESVKRSALITLAAIARTSGGSGDGGDADAQRSSYTRKELAVVHRALTEHAPVLVPFLVRMIREVDGHVDSAGMPSVAPALIASVAAAGDDGARSKLSPSSPASSSSSSAAAAGAAMARWSWLPLSASQTVVLAWCLLRCIGDVVLAEVGMVRELPELTMVNDESDAEEGYDEGDGHGEQSTATASTDGSDGRPTTGEWRGNAPQILPDVLVEVETVGMSATDPLASSGSSMGAPPEERSGGASTGWAGSTQVASAGTRPATQKGSAGESPQLGATTPPRRRSQDHSSTRRLTLLRSHHEQVLRIPEVFAQEGGVDLLTTWLRHTLKICLAAQPGPNARVPQQPHDELRLTEDEVANLWRSSDAFLLLLDVFRAIVLGSEGNEAEFVGSGGVHGLLDLIEAFARAHGLMHRAELNARLLGADDPDAAVEAFSPMAAPAGSPADRAQWERKGVLLYALTLLSDLLDSCPCALDEFSTWRSARILASPLTPCVQECLSCPTGIEAVQLLLCLWAADLPARLPCAAPAAESRLPSAAGTSGLELLRLHLRPALRMALKEEYVCQLLRRRARVGALKADAIRAYYRYIHAEKVASAEQLHGGTATRPAEGDEVTDAVVLTYMERLMARHSGHKRLAAEELVAELVSATLGLCLKVYGCLAAVGFDTLHATETELVASPSLRTSLSALERSLLVQVAALPALCVDEISTAMAEVALAHDAPPHESAEGDDVNDAEELGAVEEGCDVSTWRPTTADRRALGTAAAEAAVRAGELDQIIEVGVQVQQARKTQLYHRYLVTQLRQPVAPPMDGRPGAVKGAWKTQRRQSTTEGGHPVSSLDTPPGGQPAVCALELAARLSTRLAAAEHSHQQRIASTVLLRATNTAAVAGDDESDAGPLLRTAPPALGSDRTPYTSLMNSVNAAAADRHPATSFQVSAPPRRPAAPLTERHQKRQAMIARSLRKSSSDNAAVKSGRKA